MGQCLLLRQRDSMPASLCFVLLDSVHLNYLQLFWERTMARVKNLWRKYWLCCSLVMNTEHFPLLFSFLSSIKQLNYVRWLQNGIEQIFRFQMKKQCGEGPGCGPCQQAIILLEMRCFMGFRVYEPEWGRVLRFVNRPNQHSPPQLEGACR